MRMKTTFIQLFKFNTKLFLKKNLQICHWVFLCYHSVHRWWEHMCHCRKMKAQLRTCQNNTVYTIFCVYITIQYTAIWSYISLSLSMHKCYGSLFELMDVWFGVWGILLLHQETELMFASTSPWCWGTEHKALRFGFQKMTPNHPWNGAEVLMLLRKTQKKIQCEVVRFSIVY